MQIAPKAIEVTVKVFGGLRDALGTSTMRVGLASLPSLSDLLDAMAAVNPAAAADLRRGIQAGYLNVMVNGRIVLHSEQKQMTLCHEDAVAFLPPVGGG